MKVIYEFYPDDEELNDSHQLKLFEIAGDMFSNLHEIDNYLRELRKGWKEDDRDKIMDTISELLVESRHFEIE